MANGEKRHGLSLGKFFQRKDASNTPPAEKVRSVRKNTQLTAEDVWAHLEQTQDFLSKVKADQDHIDIHIGSDPVRIEYMSDIHMGSSIMDIPSVKARVNKIISTPGMYVIFGGDVIDGVNKEYLDTMGEQAALANINSQIEAFKAAIYYPLLRAGKVLGAVSGFGGHEEWIRKLTGMNPSRALYDDAIPYLENGGEARFYSPRNNPESKNPDLTLYLAHDDGGGNNPIDPFKGLRSAVQNNPVLDGAGSGHNHGTSAVGKIIEKTRTITYVKESTEKGNNSDKKDRLYTRDHPNARIVRGGNGYIIYDQDHGKPEVEEQNLNSSELAEDDGNETLSPENIINYNIIPAQDNYSPELAEKTYRDSTYEAIKLWDWAVRTGNLEAILEPFRTEAGGFDPILIKSRSSGTVFTGDPTTHWENLYYKMKPKNPNMVGAIKFDNLGGARHPSKQELTEEIKRRANEIAQDPFTFAVVLREMFDKGAPESPTKEKDFDRLMRYLEPALKSGKILAWLQSGSMRSKKWGDFLPAGIINERYGTPIVDNYSSLLLSMPHGPEFGVLLLDSTRFNSNTNIFHGPYKAMQKYPGHDMVLGGKSTESGYESYRDGADQSIKHILLPGWLNRESNIGEKGARELAPTNHLAAIFNMLTGEIEVGGTEYELQDLYAAIQLWMACAQSDEGLEYYLNITR